MVESVYRHPFICDCDFYRVGNCMVGEPANTYDSLFLPSQLSPSTLGLCRQSVLTVVCFELGREVRVLFGELFPGVGRFVARFQSDHSHDGPCTMQTVRSSETRAQNSQRLAIRQESESSGEDGSRRLLCLLGTEEIRRQEWRSG